MPETLTLTAAEIAQREKAIYERSRDLALRAGIDDYITDEAGTMWIPGGTSGQAKAYYAGEEGVDFTEVRCRKVSLTPDLQAVRDCAAWMAKDPFVDAETAVAYTWDRYGWLWTVCEPGHPGAWLAWECTRAAGRTEADR